MYQWNRSLNIPPAPFPGIPRAFDIFSCLGGRKFDELSLTRGGAFDHYSYGVGNWHSCHKVNIICEGLFVDGLTDNDEEASSKRHYPIED